MMVRTAIDTAELRKALGAFVTGVTIISTSDADGTPRGFTANSFTSVSLDPPLILVCIAKTASSYSIFAGSKAFAVNVLAESQKSISGVFASKATNKFENVDWTKGATGSPIFANVTAWFDCATYSAVDAGDHAILIGQVVDFRHTTANPLAYCRGGYLSLGLSQDALAAARGNACVGAVLETEGRILLLRNTRGALSLPIGSSLGPDTNPRSLLGVLRGLGIAARMNFLFAVFEDGPTESHSIFYRGVWDGESRLSGIACSYPIADIPWDCLQHDAERVMLRRFVKERGEDAFGVYSGNADQGVVAALSGEEAVHRLGGAPL